MQTKLHMIPGMGRQGDVLIMPVNRPVQAADIGELIVEQDATRVVLAHGEVTGHAHAFYLNEYSPAANDDRAIAPVRLFALKNPSKYCTTSFKTARLLRLTTRASLRHEEHAPHSFPAGDYVVIGQCEGDELEALRRVAD